ncbi:toprim domain-containing protein [Actinomadura hibisca]|uniref:toprim domain-containing protein n=1 Tax=Actinomadura hibisca TaxID=68565 RepID=UPI00083088AB|nr:toprim domain-containing protein [Actinomadura hibisca]
MSLTHDDTAVLRGVAAREAARLHDGTLPWTCWLDRAARFGRYGFVNTLLIAAQWRAATDVRSYEEWRAAGRQVRRGETGIRILARSGTPRAVFDLAQTAGLPLATPPPAVPSQVIARLTRCFLTAQAGTTDRDRARHLPDTRTGPPDQGLAHHPQDARPGPARHDLAHLLRQIALSSGARGLIEADSVAHIVLARLGLEPPAFDFPATAPWADAACGDRILRLARQLHARATDPSGDLMTAAHRYFRACLQDSWAPAYLTERGFSRSVQRRWQIGYAQGPHTLTAHLRGLGHPDEAIIEAGLARRGRSGRPYDTFRDRVMFAIRTPDGTLAGFIGRARDGASGPKYLNTPGTALFHKSELLYGLHESRDRLASGARPVLVEGPLDAIAVNLASPRDHAAVATCGLSLTPAHLAALQQAAPLSRTGVLVALDGDPAGRSAARRIWDILRELDAPVDAALLPDGRDPADLLDAGGRAAVRTALRDPFPLMDVVIDHATGHLRSAEERASAAHTALALIAAGPPAQAARQIIRLSERTDLPHHLLTELLMDEVSAQYGRAAPTLR